MDIKFIWKNFESKELNTFRVFDTFWRTKVNIAYHQSQSEIKEFYHQNWKISPKWWVFHGHDWNR